MSKKFVPKMTPQEDPPPSVFQMAWPSVGSKGFSTTFMDHLQEVERDIEAKAVKQAREKAQFIEQEAYEKGFAQGEKDGLDLGQKRVDAAVQQITNLLQEMEKHRETIYRLYEREMLQMALSISRKIIHHELRTREETVLETLREAFRHVVDQRKVLIRLHPSDVQFLETHSNSFSADAEAGQGVKIVKDPSIGRGGCVLETSFGDVDGRIEAQFDRIASLVWEKFEQSLLIPHRETT